MKMEVVEKDHQKFVAINNDQVDMDRQNDELIKRYNFLVKSTTETDNLIHSKHVESGKEKKEADMRELVHEAHDQSKIEETKMKVIEKQSKKVFDAMTKAQHEQYALKKEIQFLRGINGKAGVFMNKKQVEQLQEKMKLQKKNDQNDPKKRILLEIKRKNQEMQMKDKVHQQHWLNIQKKV